MAEPSVEIDFTEWLLYLDAVEAVSNEIPNGLSRFLERVVTKYTEEIHGNMDSRNIDWTGTYRNSARLDLSGLNGNNPTASFIIDPNGREADRLDIYWKVLEFGGVPNPNIPTRRIQQWSTEKFGSPTLGKVIAGLIRLRGIQPSPVLNTIFQLIPPSGEISGLTSHAEDLAETEANILMAELEGIYETIVNFRTGSQVRFRNSKGRFTKLTLRT